MSHRHDSIAGVVDHIGKPDIARSVWSPWAEHLDEIAGNGNIYCKLSGMATEAEHQDWKIADFEPYVRKAVQAFGIDRLMFGSDWPVCLLAASYSQTLEIVNRSLPNLTEAEQDKLFGSML